MQLTEMDPEYGRAVSVRADGAELDAEWWAPFPLGMLVPAVTIQVWGPDSRPLPLADLPQRTAAGEDAYYELADLQTRAAAHGFTTWEDCDDWADAGLDAAETAL